MDDLLSACGATDDVRQDASLVVHELVINAVVHGRPDAQDQIQFAARVVGGQLLVTVFDQGPPAGSPYARRTRIGPTGAGWRSWRR